METETSRTKLITVRLSRDAHKALRLFAVEHGLTNPEIVVKALTALFEREAAGGTRGPR